MPKRKDDPPNLVSIRVRIPEELQAECQEIQGKSSFKYDAETTFIRHLIQLGLEKYKKMLEIGDLYDKPPILTSENTPDYGVLTPESVKKAKKKGA